jgi:transposase-like protein
MIIFLPIYDINLSYMVIIVTQHYLLSAESRTLSLKNIYKDGEEAAYKKFCEIRWPETDGEAVCPRCDHEKTYNITTRRKFKCKNCAHQFSVTSGTIFASRKLDFTDLLAAICLFVNGAKGTSALKLSRDLDVQYKTAFVLSHKLREALSDEYDDMTLSGKVELDGAYFGGYIRPANFAKDRVDRRRKKFKSNKRRVVVVMRQRKGRTMTFVTKRESEGVAIARDILHEDTHVHADEATHWDNLNGEFELSRINHSEAYCENGIHTNLAESYFSRLRKMIGGQHHHASPKYLHLYAAHASWLEDHRRKSNGDLANLIIQNAMDAPVSREWKAYWQGAARRVA